MAKFEVAEVIPYNVNVVDIKLPRRATQNSAGYDLVTPISVKVPAYGRVLVPLGITCKMASYEYLHIVPRSGLANKKGLTVLNTPGTVDADYYPNSIGVILYNSTDKDVFLDKGERVAQAILQTYGRMEDDNPVEKTREGGFGSTGRS